MADRTQHTEKATPRRIEKAREEGRFPAARELVSAVQFLAFVMLIACFGGSWISAMRQTIRAMIARAFAGELDRGEIVVLARAVIGRTAVPLILAGLALIGLGIGVRLATTRMGLSVKGLTPDLKRLNGFKRLPELARQNFPALMQAIVLLPLAGFTVYAMTRKNLGMYLSLPFQDLQAGALAVAGSLEELLWKAAAVFVGFGVVDLFRQHRRYLKDLRMSKQEIRDELKEVEGNPQIKACIRRLQRDAARRRMMQEVPHATAVVVNPTHYAVALRYDVDGMAAPRVVAKGKNYLALRIKQKAVDHEVPIVENPPLAQALYRSVDVGQEIPPHLYRAVAEILAYIYRLMQGRPPV
jgi:flagellar biosynthetic protein FlhB